MLILDDLGYVQQSREEMEVLFVLLAERYERGSVLLTSNLPFSGWESIFKDPMTTAAAIDRLVHHSVILELNIPSYRAELKRREGEARGCASKQADGSRGRQADGLAGRPNFRRRQKHVEATAAAEVHHDFARPQVCGRRGIAARQAHVGLRRNRGQLFGRIAERLSHGTDAGMIGGQTARGDRPVFRLHGLFDDLRHDVPLHSD